MNVLVKKKKEKNFLCPHRRHLKSETDSAHKKPDSYYNSTERDPTIRYLASEVLIYTLMCETTK